MEAYSSKDVAEKLLALSLPPPAEWHVRRRHAANRFPFPLGHLLRGVNRQRDRSASAFIDCLNWFFEAAYRFLLALVLRPLILTGPLEGDVWRFLGYLLSLPDNEGKSLTLGAWKDFFFGCLQRVLAQKDASTKLPHFLYDYGRQPDSLRRLRDMYGAFTHFRNRLEHGVRDGNAPEFNAREAELYERALIQFLLDFEVLSACGLVLFEQKSARSPFVAVTPEGDIDPLPDFRMPSSTDYALRKSPIPYEAFLVRWSDGGDRALDAWSMHPFMTFSERQDGRLDARLFRQYEPIPEPGVVYFDRAIADHNGSSSVNVETTDPELLAVVHELTTYLLKRRPKDESHRATRDSPVRDAKPGSDSRGGGREVARTAKRSAQGYDLPELNVHFKGRDNEIADLLARLKPGARIAIKGLGGVGKTALAAATARKLIDGPRDSLPFPDGVLWHRVRDEPLDVALQRMSAALGQHSRIAALSGDVLVAVFRSEVLADRRILIILDNADDWDILRRLVNALQGISLLVTTRRFVAGFDTVEIGQLQLGPGVELFASYAQLSDSAPVAIQPVISEICIECGLLALAIQLAACRLREASLTPAELLLRLRTRKLDLLRADELLNPDAKDRDIRANFALSLDQLETDHRRVMALSGLFDGLPFSLRALEAVSDTSDESELRHVVGRLKRLSLMESGEAPDVENSEWLQVHPLLSEYALEDLSQPERAAALSRMTRFYVERFKADAEIIDSFERDHVMRALKLAFDAGDYETVCDLARDRWWDVARLGYKTDAITLLRLRMSSATALQRAQSRYRAAVVLGEIIDDSVEAQTLVSEAQRFFDWYKDDADFALRCIRHKLHGNDRDPMCYARVADMAAAAVRERDKSPTDVFRWIGGLFDAVGLSDEHTELSRQLLILVADPGDAWSTAHLGIQLAWRGPDDANLTAYLAKLMAAKAEAIRTKRLNELRATILPGIVDIAARAGVTVDAGQALADWKSILDRSSREPSLWSRYYEYSGHLALAEKRIEDCVSDFSRSLEIDSVIADPADKVSQQIGRAMCLALSDAPSDAMTILHDVREEALYWSHGPDRLYWAAVAAYVYSRLSDSARAAGNLSEYRRIYRELGRGDKPGGMEPLLRLIPEEIHVLAAKSVSAEERRTQGNDFRFEHDVPVYLPTRVRSRKDGRFMRLISHGFAPLGGKRGNQEAWFVPAFYLDESPVTCSDYARSATRPERVEGANGIAPVALVTYGEAVQWASRAGKQLPEDFEVWRAAASLGFPRGFSEATDAEVQRALAECGLPLAPGFTSLPPSEVIDGNAAREMVTRIRSLASAQMSNAAIEAIATSLSLPVPTRLGLLTVANGAGTDDASTRNLHKMLANERHMIMQRWNGELCALWWLRLATLAGLIVSSTFPPCENMGFWTCSRGDLSRHTTRPGRVAFIPQPEYQTGHLTRVLVPTLVSEDETLFCLGMRTVRRVRSERDVSDLEPIGDGQ